MAVTNSPALSTEGHYTPPRDGCRDLWAEVIAQAWRDARSEKIDRSGKAAHAPTHEERVAAVRFLSAKSGEWAERRTEVAELIGLDPDALREQAGQGLSETAPVAQKKARRTTMTPEQAAEARRAGGAKGGRATAALRIERTKIDEASSPVLQEMRRMWEAGLPARLIGQKVGLTHGSVIGHANRRGWGARPAVARRREG